MQNNDQNDEFGMTNNECGNSIVEVVLVSFQ